MYRLMAGLAAAALAAAVSGCISGGKARVWTVKGRGGMEMSVTDYGGKVVSLSAPDRDGNFEDVVAGFDDASGWDARMWNVETFDSQETGDVGFVLRRHSPDGEDGRPASMDATVTYTLTPDNKWIIDCAVMTGAPMPVDMTQHTYFNLRGETAGVIPVHRLKIAADRHAAGGTPIQAGYDRDFALDGGLTRELKPAATLWEATTGREVKVYTTEPGLHVCTGEFIGKGWKGRKRGGIALETQRFPGSTDVPSAGSEVATPSKPYSSRTVYAFGVRR